MSRATRKANELLVFIALFCRYFALIVFLLFAFVVTWLLSTKSDYQDLYARFSLATGEFVLMQNVS